MIKNFRNTFNGAVSNVQIQQDTLNSIQNMNQNTRQDYDFDTIVKLINTIQQYDNCFDQEFGEKANELRKKLNEALKLAEKHESSSKIDKILSEIRDLANGTVGSLIASGILGLLPK